MRPHTRLDRLTKRAGAEPAPLTVVLVEASAEYPPGRHERTGAAGRRVLEITFDPAHGTVALPIAQWLMRLAD